VAEGRGVSDHPILGQRLQEATRLVNRVEDRSMGNGFPTPVSSSLTLFARHGDNEILGSCTATVTSIRERYAAVGVSALLGPGEAHSLESG
jgi:hypothetical protein